MAEGSERGYGQLAKMDSTESRWVARDEEEDSDEEGESSSQRMGLESEEEDDNVAQRLIRTGPRIDSFDVEALEVPGAPRNDSEVGGTFALYSLICRNAKASLLPNQLPSDARISSFRLKVPSPELERSLKIKEYLENSLLLKKLLLILVLFGTSMVIADGVVTPAMSVMSAFSGLKLGISSVEQDEVVMISIASLIVLFSIQRPVRRRQRKHRFSASTVEVVATHELTFLFLVLPCLILGYLGQAAFLMENFTENQQVFFSSIPILGSVVDGSWVMLVFAAVLFMIMYIWNYGSKLKYETEVKQKLSMDLMMELGSNLGTIRAPGIGLVYNELVKGIPAIFGHFLTTLPAIHSMIIFVCIKYVPVPVVPQTESLEKFIRREAQERSLESDEDRDTDSENEVSCSNILVAPNGSVYSLGVPLLPGYSSIDKTISEASTSFDEPHDEAVTDARQSLERELSFIHKAKESGVVYLLGHGDIRARKESWFIKKLVINYFYSFLRRNCRRGIASLSVPHTNLMQVGMTYMV
ncbi:hypothetical protein BHM03_00049961 [Ensete ventricosum]|nr:hypothetical protein BHM03_00049961 [Ensete ventricosum]